LAAAKKGLFSLRQKGVFRARQKVALWPKLLKAFSAKGFFRAPLILAALRDWPREDQK
jgi:hypothetical protein